MDIPLHDLEERIISDCLFRSFLYFLYNTQEKHRQVRLKFISNVIKNWSYFQPFIIGDESHGISIIDQKVYKSHMSKDGVYGGEVEIQSFVQIYNVKIFIYRDNNPKPYEIGPSNSKNGVLTVLLSGVVDAGHYDVINCSNSYFWENYKKQYNHDYHEKHKDSISVKKTSKKFDWIDVI